MLERYGYRSSYIMKYVGILKAIYHDFLFQVKVEKS